MATVVIDIVQMYAAAGLVFASAFVTRGVERLDTNAAGAGWGFRLLIATGAAALWPLLLARWMRRIRGEQ